MARYTGPKSKIARKLGAPIFGADKVLSKKNYPPGQHGNSRRRKTSEYGIQLKEKQKAKYTYGVLERQFRNLFEKAQRTKGVTGEVLLQLLESRLITVDGQVVNIPSYTLKPGQVVGVREKAKSLEVITDSLAGRSHSSYSWLEWNQASLSGKFLSAPAREDIPEDIKEQLIVELYSK